MITTINGRMATIREAANLLGFSEDALRKRIKRGLLPFNKAGKKYLLDIEVVKHFLEEEALNNMNENKPEE